MSDAGDRSTLLRRFRVGILLGVLLLTLAYAYTDVRARRRRTNWERTLEIAVVVVRAGPVAGRGATGGLVDDATIELLRERARALEDRMAEEMERYRPGAPRPFRFVVLGPADRAPPPPFTGEGILAAASHQLDIYRWTSAVDDAAHVTKRAFDSRIYLSVRPPAQERRQQVEGESEAGGRVGTVTVELAPGSVDLALAVVAHETLHTLGATDKYDADGRVVVPGGLAEPDRDPLYPQRFCEIMARGRPVAPGREAISRGLFDIAVGPTTASEIRWAP